MATTTYADLASNARARITTLTAQRQEHAATILTVRALCDTETRDPNETEAEQVRAAAARRDAIDAEIEDLRSRAEEYDREAGMASRSADRARQEGRGYENQSATRGPAVYNPDSARGGTSFFRDMYFADQLGSSDARERQGLHQMQARETVLAGNERAATTSTFAGLIPPQYLVDEYAPVARAGRPIANSARRLPLPPEGMAFIIPRGTVGTDVEIQTAENTVVATQDPQTLNLTVPVATAAGHQPVSRQTLERGIPGIDQLIFADLAAAYAIDVDRQVISGTGASGQAFGILNTAGIGQSTAFTAAVTPQTLYSKTAGAVNTIETTRFLPPDVVFMHPRRWNWLTSQFDTAGRPLVVPNPQGPLNALGVVEGVPNLMMPSIVGTQNGLPVILDASLPSNVGAASEDVEIVARRFDMILWEDGDGAPRQLRFEQTLGTQLTVELVAYDYFAFTAGRFPTAVAVVGGNSAAGFGLVAPTF
ncbi:MAG: phage major capsid protein [Acidobacteria bacterium]|nr:phage major capsid protein [Acidobacteriota bacterium]